VVHDKAMGLTLVTFLQASKQGSFERSRPTFHSPRATGPDEQSDGTAAIAGAADNGRALRPVGRTVENDPEADFRSRKFLQCKIDRLFRRL
jgi:hypothetical protein